MKTFKELLKMQENLDWEIAKTRHNGFEPRKRNELDILLALDDELQEWLKELPTIYNFKTWKQKEYSREKELEEFTDVLFFYLQLHNLRTKQGHVNDSETIFDNWIEMPDSVLRHYIMLAKQRLWECNFDGFLQAYIKIAKLREFSKDEIVECYIEKYNKNLKRIKGDWTK